MYDQAQQYRRELLREVNNAMAIVPHDTAFKTQLYKSICSIPHDLPIDLAVKIRQEIFEELNKRFKPIG